MGMRLPKELEQEILARADKVGPSMTINTRGCEPMKPGTLEALARVGKQVAEAVKRGPNKLESAYAAHLEVLKRAGEIVDYGYEAIKFKIGVKKCWYTVDFWVLAKDGVLECHECKGFMRDDARVKLQSAARQYPCFRFFLVRKEGKSFRVGEVR